MMVLCRAIKNKRYAVQGGQGHGQSRPGAGRGAAERSTLYSLAAVGPQSGTSFPAIANSGTFAMAESIVEFVHNRGK